jgi:hypothetical protein
MDKDEVARGVVTSCRQKPLKIDVAEATSSAVPLQYADANEERDTIAAGKCSQVHNQVEQPSTLFNVEQKLQFTLPIAVWAQTLMSPYPGQLKGLLT